MIVYVVIKRYAEYFTLSILNIFTDKENAVEYAKDVELDSDEEVLVLKMKTDTENPYPYKNIIYKRVL